MGYIILNGEESSTIQGLIISNLPPISKPEKRIEKEEIDGKDGDIITCLGYSAYDKEVDIGLHGNYDINEVIKYFDSEGVVTFSNEPDKYYRYAILEQIDFERLLRFRTAKVKFHVQPYKYNKNESKQILEITDETQITVTNLGNTISKPIITFHGAGDINIELNNHQLLVVSLKTLEEGPDSITIDFENMEAYSGKILRNRSVTGDYDKFNLAVGSNTISWTSGLAQIEISQISRWI